MSIDSKELRVGNNLFVNGKIVTIDAVDILGVQNKNIDYFSPIPLTPSILEQCGFRKGGEKESDYVFDLPNDNLLGYGWGGFENQVDLNGMVLPIEIKYVHQLQNLIFAISNQEIEVNLT